MSTYSVIAVAKDAIAPSFAFSALQAGHPNHDLCSGGKLLLRWWCDLPAEPERCSSWTGRPQFVDFRGGASLTPPVPPWALPGGGGAPELGRGLERRLSAGGERAAAAAKLERRSLSARLERRLSVGHLYASRSSNDRGSASNSLQGGLSGLRHHKSILCLLVQQVSVIVCRRN